MDRPSYLPFRQPEIVSSPELTRIRSPFKKERELCIRYSCICICYLRLHAYGSCSMLLCCAKKGKGQRERTRKRMHFPLYRGNQVVLVIYWIAVYFVECAVARALVNGIV